MAKKSSTLCVFSKQPGVCGACRHSNQGTVDFSEGHVFCAWRSGARHPAYRCDVKMMLPRDTTDAAGFGEYFAYEPFDGKNCTWDRKQDTRVIAEDAGPSLRASLQADVPFIPADEA